MSSNIDKRIVEMDFDNSRFEKNVNQSISSLDKLKNALNMKGATNGFNQLEKNINSIDLSGLEKSISNIEHRFSALGIAGATVISNLTTKAMGMMSKFNNAIFGQMKSGGISRALNLEHANFMLNGLLKDADKVSQIMGEGGPVQNAVKGTAYGLDAAANAAAQFVASGVKDMDKLESALTAISGAAAMTGSSYEDISRIFTTVAGNGRLMADQLNQFSSRGLNAAAALAEHLGKTEGEIREMVSKGKIDFETFADVMNKAFGEQAKKANDTFTGALSNVKAALSRIGAKVAQPTIENLRKVFVSLIPVIDGISKTLQPLIDVINMLINKFRIFAEQFLHQSDKIQTIVSNVVGIILIAFDNLIQFLKPITKAFRDVFPKKTMDDAISLTEKIGNLLAQFRISKETAEKLRSTFRGLFAIFDLVGQAVGAIVRAFFPSITTMKDFGSSVLDITAKVGDFLYALSKSVRENKTFDKFLSSIKSKFAELKEIVGPVIEKIKEFAKAHFKVPEAGSFSKFVESLKNGGDLLGKVFGKIKSAFIGTWESLKKTFPFFTSLGRILGDGLKQLGQALANVLNGKGFDDLISLVKGGVLVGLGVEISKFIETFTGAMKKTTEPSKLSKTITKTLTSLKDTLQEFQTTLKIQNLLTIAKAIGIIAISLVALSLVDPERLVGAVMVVTVMFKELEQMAKSLTKMVQGGSFAELGKISSLLIAMSAAVLILSIALAKLSTIPTDQLVVGLTAVTILLAEMTLVALALGKWGNKIQTGAISIIAFAIAVNIVASALKKIGDIPMEELKRGILGLSVVMGELAVAAAVMGMAKFGASQGAGILMMAAALKILVGVLDAFCKIPEEKIGNGLGIMAAILGEIAIFMLVVGNFAEHVLSTSAALLIMSTGLLMISSALSTVAGLGNDGITAIEVLGGALVLMSVALGVLGKNAGGVLAAATAITMVAIAMNLLLIPMAAFAAMGWKNLLPALVGLAVAVAAVAIPLGILAGLGPALLIVGGAFALMGVGIAAVGAGILAIAAAISLIAATGAGAIVALTGILNVVILSIPVFGKAAAEMIMAFIVTLADGAVLIIDAVVQILRSVLTAIIQMTPMLGQAVITVGMTIIRVINTLLPPLITTILNAVLLLLKAIEAYIPSIVETGCNIIIALMDGIAQKTPEIIDSMFNLAITMINGLADGLSNNEAELYSALDNLFNAIMQTLGDWLPQIFDKGIDLLHNLINGMLSIIGELAKAGVELLGEFLKAIGVPDDIIDTGVQWVQGLIDGIISKAKELYDKVAEVAHNIVDKFNEIFKINSPSVVMTDTGENIDKGLEKGIKDNKDLPINAIEEVGNAVAEKAEEKGTDAANAFVNAYNSIMSTFNANRDKQNAAEDQKRSDMMGYNSIEALTRAGQAGLIKIDHKSTETETKATTANTGATKGNTKAKKENKEANEKKNKSIDEESEALGEETEAADENEEAIRELAEQIFVVTEAYHHLRDYLYTTKDKFKIGAKSVKALGNAFSSVFGKEALKATNGVVKSGAEISKVFKEAGKTIPKTTDKIKKGLYAFTGEEYDKKMTKRLKKVSKSVKSITKQVEKTGKTIAKVSEGSAKMFYKNGNKVETQVIRLTKNVKNLAKYLKKAQSFAASFNGLNGARFAEEAQNFEDFQEKLRGLEKYYKKLSDMTQPQQSFVKGIVDKFKVEFERPMQLLTKQMEKVTNWGKGKSTSITYVADAFLSLASTLYDGTDAANEYYTQIARLEFLFKEGVIEYEELEEAKQGYLQRSIEALKEYYTTLQETLAGQFNIFEEFDQKLDDQQKDLIGNIESQIAGFNNLGQMLMELSKRNLDFNLLKQLTDQGADAYGIIKNLLSMTNNELALFQLRYQQSSITVQETTDMMLAALANARVMATSKKAEREGKQQTAKMIKESTKAARQIADNNKAVARNQAIYNKLTKKEVKEYLKTLDKQQQKEYKAAYKAEKKRQKQLKAAAAVETANRKEKERLQTIKDSITTFTDYITVLNKYAADNSVIASIMEDVNKAFEPLNGIIVALGDESIPAAQRTLYAFAETLEATGEDGLSYFEEMAKRVENYNKTLKDAVKEQITFTSEIKKSENGLTSNKIVSNVVTNLKTVASVQADTQKIIDKFGLSSSNNVIADIGEKLSKGNFNDVLELIESYLNMTQSEMEALNASFTASEKLSKEIADNITAMAAKSAYNNQSQQIVNTLSGEIQTLYEQYYAIEKERERIGALAAKNSAAAEYYWKQYDKAKTKSAKKDAEAAATAAQNQAYAYGKQLADMYNQLVSINNDITAKEATIAEERKKAAAYDLNYNTTKELQEQQLALQTAARSIMSNIKDYKSLMGYLTKVNGQYQALVSSTGSIAAEKINAGITKVLDSVSGAVDKYKNKWKEFYITYTGVWEKVASGGHFKVVRGSVKNYTDDIYELTKAFIKLGDSLESSSELTGDYFDDLSTKLNEYRNTLYDTIKGQVSLFDEFKKYSGDKATDAGKYLDNMNSQIEGLEEWMNNMQTLADRGVTSDILKMFAAEGQNSFEKVAAFANATDSQLGELITNYKKYLEVTEAATDTVLASVAYTYSDTITSITQKLLDSFDENAKDRTKQIGEDASEMLVTGIKNGLTNAMPAITEAITSTDSTTQIATKVGSAVGAAINQGVVQSVANSVEDVVNSVIEKFKMAVDSINSYVEETLNDAFNITIHVNASEIDMAVARMNSAIYGINADAMTTGQSVTSSISNRDAAAATVVSGTAPTQEVSVTYTQNNYSPKALSRTEIYRQTKNQLSTIESVVAATGG